MSFMSVSLLVVMRFPQGPNPCAGTKTENRGRVRFLSLVILGLSRSFDGLSDRDALKDRDGGVADQIGRRGPELCAADRASHRVGLLVFKSSCHSAASGR